ncbi:MAG: ribonuclease III [Clostridiales bacterium]|nr:ribonuclease III [Clostridiales bacterium]
MEFRAVDTIKCTTLAFVGDAVFSLYVRSQLGGDPRISTKELMSRSSTIVSAVVQARIHDAVLDSLTEDEQALMNRCRNAHVVNKAKNASMREYKKATALEGLLGALYLTGQTERLDKLLKICYEIGGANE